MAFERLRGNPEASRFEVRLKLAAEQTIDGPAALFELWRTGDSLPLACAPLGPLQELAELVAEGLPRSTAKAARQALAGIRVNRISGDGVELCRPASEQEISFLRVGGTAVFSPSRPSLAPLELAALAPSATPAEPGQPIGI